MKTAYIKILSLVMLVSLLISCKKWVDYNPREDFRITELDYLKSESDYRTMAVSTYTPMQWMATYMVMIGDIASDNSVSGGENASDVLSFQQIDDYTHTPINANLTEVWQAAYEGINRCNYLFQYREANPAGERIVFAGKDAMYAEVAFLRAFYYFSLVKMFGDVPLFVDRRLSLADSKKLSRTEKSKVYEQVENDLKNAIKDLPAIQQQKGRITKYAAQALLGKVYLYQGKYNDAVTALQPVVADSSLFPLVANFKSIFLSSGENGPESVFEIQYSNTSPYYNWGGVTRGQGNLAVQMCGIRGLNGTDAMPYASGWSFNLPTQNLSSAYTAGDQRKEATILDIEAYKNANPSFNITYQVAPYKNTGLYNQKYHPRKGETSGQIELNYLNNFRMIRFSDVLLMAAEAHCKATAPDFAKAQTFLNQVRRRAFGNSNNNITATGDALYLAVLEERRLELAMEGERFFDLVRTNQTNKITGFVKGKHEVFPIPQREVDISGLTQNPGY